MNCLMFMTLFSYLRTAAGGEARTQRALRAAPTEPPVIGTSGAELQGSSAHPLMLLHKSASRPRLHEARLEPSTEPRPTGQHSDSPWCSQGSGAAAPPHQQLLLHGMHPAPRSIAPNVAAANSVNHSAAAQLLTVQPKGPQPPGAAQPYPYCCRRPGNWAQRRW